jgi:ATP phosphoribosyltransferase
MRDKDQVLLENLYNNVDNKSKLENLKTKIRYAMKTNNKAELSFAQEELYQLATRFNLMKDPEVLELLADSDVAHVTGNRQ